MAARKIPEHLRRYTVAQQYSRYNEVSHALWRFVLLQLRSGLQQTAHPAYIDGLSAIGIEEERIPRIEHMNERLGRFGWGAVCVDGFIPPRAFQAFQAARILPIAGEIRTLAHLAYTPAPDIIHEAAGHAPIVSDPTYAHFLEEIGRVGLGAFSSPQDRALYRTIHALSVIKEQPEATAQEIARREEAFERARRSLVGVSEASTLARLYWWTAEYGLVGTPDEYRIYGAGLLSSLGESYSCHAPSVRKLPLTAACVHQDYDITTAQPQLYVTPSFDALFVVLDEVAATLSERQGGLQAVRAAVASQEPATLVFSDGPTATRGFDDGQATEIFGVIQQLDGIALQDAMLVLDNVGFAHGGRALEGSGLDGSRPGHAASARSPLRAEQHLALLGPLRGGDRIAQWLSKQSGLEGSGREITLEYASGATLRGRVVGSARASEQSVPLLDDVSICIGRRTWRAAERYPLLDLTHLKTAHAGSRHAAFFEQNPNDTNAEPVASVRPVPGLSALERRRVALYEQAHQLKKAAPKRLLPGYQDVHDRLRDQLPDDWLLRWTLLDGLVELDVDCELRTTLRRELERLEEKFSGREPIASGLCYLDAVNQPPHGSSQEGSG
jgi:phenylalanine-4-hydroxylase